MSDTYVKSYDINFYDTDYTQYCKITHLVDFLCDVGIRHAAAVGDTSEALIKKGHSWVFYSYDIKMKKYPKYLDKVKVETNIASFTRFYALREYKILNEDNEVLCEASALFFLIDFKKRRPIRIPKEKFEAFKIDESDNKEVNINKIADVEREDCSKKFKVELEAIDSNRHVTNVKYIEWAIRTTNIDILKDYIVEKIKVIYEKEVLLDDEITCYMQVIEENEENISCLYNIKNSQGKCVNKIEIVWKRK